MKMPCHITDVKAPNDPQDARDITDAEIKEGESIALEKYVEEYYQNDRLGFISDQIVDLSVEKEVILFNLICGDDNDGAITLEIHSIFDELKQILKEKTDAYAADNNWWV